MWVKVGGHPCWRVQKALDKAGVDYEVVQHHWRRGKRDQYEQLSGTKILPALELGNGQLIREESKDLVKRIKEGRLSAA
jgi:glutathione S-transferase